MKSRVQNVVAAIDGSHIPIKAPLINHEDYSNRKHFYSCFVQEVVDYTGLFLSVAAGFPGSLHDAGMLRLSDFYWAAEIKMKTFSWSLTLIRYRHTLPCSWKLCLPDKDLASIST